LKRVAWGADDGAALNSITHKKKFELVLMMATEWLLTKANPWELPALHWGVGFLAVRGAIGMYDHLVVGFVELSKQAKLPTRTIDGPPVRYVGLDATSVAFLFVNALQEWVFVQNLCFFIWHSPAVPKSLADVGFLNTGAALWLMFVVLDVCYAPMHRFLHWRPVYPYIHKHHHRQIFPVRGYLDAGNEHPLEHFIGTSCTWAAVYSAVLVRVWGGGGGRRIS
jgi:sterol desaturase/sphingolipid hydroxylase (fatty acid hydroxylase superfamily)